MSVILSLLVSIQWYDPQLVKPRHEHSQDTYYSYWRSANRQAPLLGGEPARSTTPGAEQGSLPASLTEKKTDKEVTSLTVALPAITSADRDKATKARWSIPAYIKPMSKTTADYD